MISLTVDNRVIEAAEGTTLLTACLDNGIFIPHLCHLEELGLPYAGCRLCFVEIQNEPVPVPSCTRRVQDHMVVRTDTPQVRRLQRMGLELLLSVHDVDCKNCHANRRCQLQIIAKFLKISLKSRRLTSYRKTPEIDDSHNCLIHYPNRCVLCARCIRICRDTHGSSCISFTQRGFDTVIRFQGPKIGPGSVCVMCGACAEACPVGALRLKEQPSVI